LHRANEKIGYLPAELDRIGSLVLRQERLPEEDLDATAENGVVVVG